ncbi:MAG: potassium channel family protein [Usitatibacteraceae bacterium]
MESVVQYDNWGINFAVVALTVAAIAASVLVHYEGLSWLNRALARGGKAKRRVVIRAILAIIALHIIEIWVFALAYHFLLLWPAAGRISGAIGHSVLDHAYFSATVFTTVGFGDLSPTGPIRFLAGTEGLTGLVLIGWSASFTYLEMERLWRPHA